MKERRLTGLESLNEIWNDLFLNAIYSGNIYVKGNNFHIEYNGVDNIINCNQFKMAFQETFYKVYRENIYPAFGLKSLSSEQVITVCAWLNPALGDLKLDGYEEYKKRLRDRYTVSGKNYDESDTKLFKMQLRSTLFGLNEAQRKKYIEYLMPYEILGLNDLIDLEYYTDIPKSEVLEEYKDENGKLSDEVLQSLSELSMEKIVDLKNSKHKVSSNKIKRYTQFIPNDFLITMAEHNQIPYSYLEYSNITKKDIFSMRYEAIVSVLHNIDKYPEKLRITSQDILDEYGKTINGSRLYKFVMYGFVDSKQVIDIIRLNKVLRLAGESEENLYNDEEVLSYYSSTRLAEMFLTGEIDTNFIEKYQSALNSQEKFEKKSELAIEQIKQKIMLSVDIPAEEKEKSVQQSVLNAYNLGLCTPAVLRENISSSFLEELYLRGDISDADILSLYRVGVVDEKVIKEYFSDEDIFELYLHGNLDRDSISIMEDEQERDEKILESVIDEKMPLIDVVYLYLNGNLSIPASIISNDNYIYYTSVRLSNNTTNTSVMDIYICNVDGSDCRVFSSLDAFTKLGDENIIGNSLLPSLSVNDEYLYYTSVVGDVIDNKVNMDIYRCNIDGTNCNKFSSLVGLVEDDGSNMHPTILADNNNVYYTTSSDTTSVMDIYRCDKDGGNCNKITSASSYLGGADSPISFSPKLAVNDSYLYFTSSKLEGSGYTNNLVLNRCNKDGSDCKTIEGLHGYIASGLGISPTISVNNHNVYYLTSKYDNNNSSYTTNFSLVKCNIELEECSEVGSVSGFANSSGSTIYPHLLLTK